MSFPDLYAHFKYFDASSTKTVEEYLKDRFSYLSSSDYYYDCYSKERKIKIGNYSTDIIVEKSSGACYVYLLFEVAPNLAGEISTSYGRIPKLEEIKLRTEKYLTLLSPEIFR